MRHRDRGIEKLVESHMERDSEMLTEEREERGRKGERERDKQKTWQTGTNVQEWRHRKTKIVR